MFGASRKVTPACPGIDRLFSDFDEEFRPMGKWLQPQKDMTFEVEDHVCYITFSHPEKRNAISMAGLYELQGALMEADDRKDIRVIVLGGEGKDFCAGADISGGASPEELAYDPSRYRKVENFDDDAWGTEQRSNIRQTIFRMHKPVIAKVQGNCLAAGTDIALMCDFIIVSNTARIGFPATRSLGSPANHMWLYHVGPQWAKRMLMTGDCINGRDAARIGLVLKSVPAEKLDAAVDAFARRLALIGTDLMATHKRIVNLGLELMGQATLQRLAAENDSRAHLSTSLRQFMDNVKSKGMKEAVRLRDEPYGREDISLDSDVV
jgi:enoyl-CoA hydratase